jgi:hypothetical protein
MKKQLSLVGILAIAFALGTAGIAAATNTQTMKVTISPSKAPKQNRVGAAVTVLTTTGTDGSTVTPTTRVVLAFDNDIDFFTTGYKQCKESQLQNKTTAQAKSACGAAQIGGGTANVAVGGDPANTVSATITAFNGTVSGGKPVILLHSFAPSLGFTSVLKGVLFVGQGQYGHLLNVAVPELPFGTAITRFQTRVSKTFNYKGKTRHYVSARCFDGNHKWNYKGTFAYKAPEPTQNLFSAQTCQVKG